MTSPTSVSPVGRIGALVCGLLYLPLGLVWAYGFALVALPVALLGFWLLRRADRREQAAGFTPSPGQKRLGAIAKGVLCVGLAASVVALVLTK